MNHHPRRCRHSMNSGMINTYKCDFYNLLPQRQQRKRASYVIDGSTAVKVNKNTIILYRILRSTIAYKPFFRLDLSLKTPHFKAISSS